MRTALRNGATHDTVDPYHDKAGVSLFRSSRIGQVLSNQPSDVLSLLGEMCVVGSGTG